MVFVYHTMKNIRVMKPSILLSKSLCHMLRNLKKKNVYQTIKKVSLYGTFLKFNLRPIVSNVLSMHGIEFVIILKSVTHLLRQLDLTANTSLKKTEQKAFSDYFSSSIMEALKETPSYDVTAIRIDLRLSVFKCLHANAMKDADNFSESSKGKEGMESSRYNEISSTNTQEEWR